MSEAVQPLGRALLVGARTGGLGGVDASLGRFADLLESRGFVTTRLVAGEATRPAVLEELDRIGVELESNQPFVFFYAGHGHRWFPPDDPPQIILVLPGTRESTEADFRGLLANEVLERLCAFSERTSNITTVLDCCHSEGAFDETTHGEDQHGALRRLSRQAGAAIEAKTKARTRAQGSKAGPHGLDAIVRISATAAKERAYGRGRGRDSVGLLTHTLVDVLEDHPDEPWVAVMTRVRARVHARRRTQRPDVQGPWHRLPFSLDESTLASGRLPSVPLPELWVLEGIALLTAQVGDVYRLCTTDDSEPTLEARVMEVRPQHVLLRAEHHRSLHGRELSWAEVARPHTPHLVRVRASPELEDRLRNTLDPSAYALCTRSEDERTPAVTLVQEAEELVVVDHLDDRIAVVPPTRLHDDLHEWLRRATTFWRCIQNLRSDDALEDALVVRWWRKGDDAWFELQNPGGPYINLHVTAHRIDRSRVFHSLTGPSSSGTPIGPGASKRLSFRIESGLAMREGVFFTISSHPLSLHDIHDGRGSVPSTQQRSLYGRAKPARETRLFLLHPDEEDDGWARVSPNST